jgi:hypothetical protein
MLRRVPWSVLMGGLLTLGWLGDLPSRAVAQPGDGPAVLPEGGEEQLNKAFDANTKKEFEALLKGQSAAKAQQLIDLGAQWYTFRSTWVTVQNKPASLHQVVVDFKAMSEELTKLRKANETNAKLLAAKLGEDLKLVTQKGNNVARLHAALCLPYLGKTGLAEAEAALTDILNDKQNDAVKLYACKGLKEYFTTTPPKANNDGDRKAVAALVAFVARKPALPSEPSKEEVEAVRYIRRHAVIALALTRLPVVRDPMGTKIEVPVAYQLLTVLAKQGLTPEPEVAERLEAAVGLCQLKHQVAAEYQADVALYHVAQFMRDFSDAYNRDRELFLAANPKDKTQPKKIRGQPWKIDVYRLDAALKEMDKDLVAAAKGGQANPRATALVKELLLRNADLIKVIDKNEAVENQLREDLKTTAEKYQPKGTEVYKGNNQFQIKASE